MQAYEWSKYGSIIQTSILHPEHNGFFSVKEADSKDFYLAIGKQGSLSQGAILYLYWLVRKRDGVIEDAKFQVYGPTSLIAAGEITCKLCKGKNYDQASRISADLIDQNARDSDQGFSKEAYSYLNLVLIAIDEAVYQCRHIPFVAQYEATPFSHEEGEFQIIEEFFSYEPVQQLKIIEEVLDKEIRPYIELDAGGIKVKKIEGEEITVLYEGACTTCPSSIGSTLSAIQNILQNRIHPHLKVSPEF